jgi:SAM-dependent methyltransferase
MRGSFGDAASVCQRSALSAPDATVIRSFVALCMAELLNPDKTSVYYQHSGGLPLASRVSLAARRKMFRLFLEWFRPGPATSVLDVGVTCDSSFAESNCFEQLYPYPHNIVCVGTEDGTHLTHRHPGVRYERVRPGEPLPFRDREFDIVFSNAVLEHVGSRGAQQAFLREVCRVGRGFFVTTPNRWFPIEHHTGIPLLHHLPAPLFRYLIRHTRFRYWSDEANLNLLSAADLARVFPPDIAPAIRRIRTAGFTSNLVALGRSAG